MRPPITAIALWIASYLFRGLKFESTGSLVISALAPTPVRTRSLFFKSVLDADLPNLVQLDVSTLAGVLAAA